MSQKKQALIVWGGWPGHEPEACAAVIAGLLREEGFEVQSTPDFNAFGDASVHRMNLVVPVITRAKIEKGPLDNLVAAVQSGVGLAGCHGGLAGSFREEVAFHFMCGCQWVAHPGNIIPFRVNVTKPGDPVMKGIADFDYLSEQYFLHVDPSIETLATTTFSGEHAPWTKGVVMPVVYKKHYGEGRVFYSALGHSACEFEHEAMRTLLKRGMLWAAR
ncbi:ThuA domain-containing protein [Terrarubrum flagellatum]|uniref:ThuA domain-containing protein n=1 Tax=Terrirubrum flagellatum TaxID=2895980 RepID=UPI0031453292